MEEKIMSRGFSQRGADGITRHYNSNGVMTGHSQMGGDGITRHYDNRNNVTGFSQWNGYGGMNHYDNRGNKRKSCTDIHLLVWIEAQEER